MLTIYQSEKVAVAQKLLTEVQEEIAEKDTYKAILLGSAASSCAATLKDDLPDGYTYIAPKEALEYEPTIGDRILNVLGWIAGTSLIASALCACLSLGSWGISEYKSASGIRDHTDYAANTRGYRGFTFTFLSITLVCGVLGSVVGDAVYRGNE